MATIHRLPQPGEKRTLNYRMAARGDRAEILLYDIIGEGWIGGISAKQFTADLKALGNVKTLDVRINSEGGDVFDGRTIYTQLSQHNARVVVHVDALAASIASLIAMAGDEIRMADGSYIMVHNAWSVAIGDADEMRRTADLLDSVSGSIADTYTKRTKQPRKKIDDLMAAETWMTAEQAISLGFADVMAEPAKMAAAVSDPKRFRNLPTALQPGKSRVAAAAARIRSALSA